MIRRMSDGAIVERLKAADTVPEPSPLFWEHAAGRVRAAVADEPPRRSGWWGRLAWSGGALAAAALAVVLVLAARQAPERPATPAVSTAPALAEVAHFEDDPWMFVAELGGDLDVDAAARAGLFAAGDTTDRAVQALDEAERTELATLLHRALEGPEI